MQSAGTQTGKPVLKGPRKASESTQLSGPAEAGSTIGSEEAKSYSPLQHGSCTSAENSEGEDANQTILENYNKIWEIGRAHV